MLIDVLATLALTTVTCLPPTAARQDKPAAPHGEVRLELTGPWQATCVWAASEWTLKFDNLGPDGLPFRDELLDPAGCEGANVKFEIAKGGVVLRTFASRSFDLSSNCSFRGPRTAPDAGLLAPGKSGELPVVLHGEMRLDFEAYGRKEKVYVRFEPAFAEPGSYNVTALLFWNGVTTRSNSVELEVAGVPASSQHAVEELEAMAKEGICLDVQGLSYNEDWSVLERIDEFVASEGHTLYGAQLRIGLARALLGIYADELDLTDARNERLRAMATLEHVKSLLAQPPPVDLGLDRAVKQLRDYVALEERKAHH
jgi:hypothetical protein